MRRDIQAKLAFAVILVATLLFAYWVQMRRTRGLRLDLDQTVAVASGRVTLGIDSNWTGIPEPDLPTGAVAGWNASAGEIPVEVYVGLREAGLDSLAYEFLDSLDRYTEAATRATVAQADYEKDLAPLDGLGRTRGWAVLSRGQAVYSIAIEVVALPDGGTVDVAVLAGTASAAQARQWVEQLSGSLKVSLPEAAATVAAGEPVEVGGWRVAFEGPVYVCPDQEGTVTWVMPRGASSSAFWSAQFKPLALPDYREPEQLIADGLLSALSLGEPLAISRLPGADDPAIYKGFVRYGRDMPGYQNLIYLGVADGGAALLGQVGLGTGPLAETAAVFDRVVSGLKFGGDTAEEPMPLDVRAILAAADVDALADRASGWFEVRIGDQPIGFLMSAIQTSGRTDRINASNFLFIQRGELEYEQGTVAEFTGDLSAGRTAVTLAISVGRQRHSVARKVEFDERTIEMLGVINRQRMTLNLERPKEFVCDGADLLLIAALAEAGSPQSGYASRPTDLSTALSAMRIDLLPDATVATLNDYEFERARYLFDEEGVWQGIRFGPDLVWTRVEERDVAGRYPAQYRRAVRWVLRAVGGDRI